MHKHHHHHDEEWDAGDARFRGPQGAPGWGPPPGYGWGGRPFPPPGAFGGFGPWMFRGGRSFGFGPWMFRGWHGPFGQGFGPGRGGPGPGPGFHGWGGPEPDAEGEWHNPQFRGGWGGGWGHHGHHGHHGRHGGRDVAGQIARLEQVQAFLEQRLADVQNALEHLRAQQHQHPQDQPPGGPDRPTVHL